MVEGMDSLNVTLPGDLTLARCLVDLGRQIEGEGLPLRIVGGTAMMVWKLAADLGAFDVTRDLDLAVLGGDVPNEAKARGVGNGLHSALGRIGARRPEVWRESRVARFKYAFDGPQATEVDVLCGDLPVGSASRRAPAWRIARLDGVKPGEATHFYAARVPWLDFVEQWVPVIAGVAGDEVRFKVPSASSMAILKLGAVNDKMKRVLEPVQGQRFDFERLRLERHAAHLVEAIEMTRQLGQLDRLQAIKRAHPEVALTAQYVERSLRDIPSLSGPVLGAVRVLAD
jgi:hypothetical protein